MSFCARSETDHQVIRDLEENGFTQDPDVLDTWFSSGLWPISTLGWPDESAIGDPRSALNTWNPSDTLCTAREIITLWVSRMVMFNLFFRNCLPFKDVFIHAMIQDGEGQKMSKSLGNGVDPLDIIHSHGADAMRFTLVAMTTQTQDVRMPVDIVCPHCGSTFHPPTKRTSAGHIVAKPIVKCTDCGKAMASSYGIASGETRATEDAPAARNTSSKFDFGRNFANKVWNATRFVLSKLEEVKQGDGNPRALADRWILSRLARTLREVDGALEGYEFKNYADALYDFIWRDFCDWYVEAVKPVAGQGRACDAVLPAVLDAIARLLHPAMPYLTEQLWIHLRQTSTDRSIEGLRLPAGDLCMKAPWPAADDSLLDEEAERQFEVLQQIITAIRNVRNEHNVSPKQVVTVRIATAEAEWLDDARELIETLAGANVVQIAAKVQAGAGAASVNAAAAEVFIEGLVDPQAEAKRLSKNLEDLGKSIKQLEGRLANPGYTDKAPAHLVQQTRDQLEKSRQEFAAIEQKLASMQ